MKTTGKNNESFNLSKNKEIKVRIFSIQKTNRNQIKIIKEKNNKQIKLSRIIKINMVHFKANSEIMDKIDQVILSMWENPTKNLSI